MLFSVGENKIAKIIIFIVFLCCFASLIIAILINISDNFNIERQHTVIKINVTNKLNICKPENQKKIEYFYDD